MQLNVEQQRAVDCNDKKIVCLAGAGAGKTAVLIERISRLVREGEDPNSILVLTFTKAAAMEMRERYYRSHDKHSESPDFRTFHSFCYSVLSRDSGVRKALGYTSVPVIADDNTQKRIETETKLQIGLNVSDKKLNQTDGLTPKERYELNLYKKALSRRLKAKDLITFDTLSEDICNLFVQNDASIQYYKQKLKYIFVDEFQDTDKLQFQFIDSFKDCNLFVVGDALQSIYAFRNADSKIIKSLVDSPDWTTIKLYHNYRSYSAICDYANKNTNYANPKYKIELVTDKAGGVVEEFDLPYRLEMGELDSEELIWISENVLDLQGSTAILCRTRLEVAEVKNCLKSNSIPFVTNKRDKEIEYILNSVFDDEYFLDWVTMYLNKSQYHQYLRHKEVENPENPVVDFYTKYSSYPAIKYRLDTVFGIREILNKDELPFIKCHDIFKLLGMKNMKVDTNAQSPIEIMQYIVETCQQHISSDIYVGTIHSVKGLEYDNVILLGVDGESFKLEDEDNQNLFYVGITRARSNLYVFRYQ